MRRIVLDVLIVLVTIAAITWLMSLASSLMIGPTVPEIVETNGNVDLP